MCLKKLPQLLWAKRRESKPHIKQKTTATTKTQTNGAKKCSFGMIYLAQVDAKQPKTKTNAAK